VSTKDLRPLFNPRSIAIVGCSPISSGKLGSWPLRNLLLQESPVDIYPVNPGHRQIDGLACYPALRDVPAAPDVVLVMVPASQSIHVLEEADAVGARAAIVFGGGFGETEQGRALEARLAAFASSSAMPICGPNTDGIINVVDGIPCGFPPYAALTPRPVGDVAVVSQSGALVSTLVMRLIRNQVGLTYSCAIGNAVDLGLADYLHHLATDERTSTILVYTEGIGDPQAFVDASARAIEAGKLVVVLKGGRSPAGSAAAQSHTGSMVGSYDAVLALCEKHHIIVADNFEEFAALPALAPAAKRLSAGGRRAGLLSGSGAVGGFMADKASQFGFAVPEFGAETIARLVPRFHFTTPRNPIDLTGQVVHDPQLHVDVLEALAADPGIDVIVASSLYGPADITDRLKNELVEVHDRGGTPVIVYAADGNDASDEPILAAGGVPVLPSADVLFGSLSRLVDCLPYVGTRRAVGPAPVIDVARRDDAVTLLGPSAGVVAPAVSWRLLERYGVPVAAERVVASPSEACEVAAALGYPVVAKVSGASAPHKSDLGLVELDLADVTAVTAAYERLQAARDSLGLRDADVVLQPMVPPGVELIVGVRTDPEVGPVVALGAGGIFTEVLRDVVVAPAPLDETQVRSLLERLRVYPLLTGARGTEPCDLDALGAAVVALSTLASELAGAVTEIEINPLIVSPKGAVAVDVLAAAPVR
jgi:acyl-CoA synthetase (NDP forming)